MISQENKSAADIKLSTKEMILEKALELFNQDGVLQTSTRDIAEACGISQGNLTYHFARKNDIVVMLFLKIKEVSDRIIDQKEIEDFTLNSLKEYIEKQFFIMHQYRFFFLDFLNILREIPALKKQYGILNETRKKQFYGILTNLEKNGILNCKFSPAAMKSLYTAFSVYFNFWLTDAEITGKKCGNLCIKEYAQTALQIFLPYLKN